MRLHRIIRYPITVLVILAAVAGNAQSGAWFKRTWLGRAYLLGADPQNYNLVLTISSVKGKNFEGTMKVVQAADTSVHFDTKVAGFIYDRYMQINIAVWKVKCGTCKPQVMAYSIESGRFFLKGEAKGCSTVECTWITEFSQELTRFNATEKESLYAIAEEIKTPEPDTAVVAQNINVPIKDTAAATPKEIAPPPPQRIVILPAGNIVLSPHNTASLFSPKPPAFLHKMPSMLIPQTTPQPPKITVLPAGDIVLSERNTASLFSQKPPVSLHKTPLLIIPQTTPQPLRVTVLPAGDIVLSEHNNASLFSQKPPGLLQKTPSMIIPETTPQPLRVTVLPAGDIVLREHTALPNLKPPNPLPRKNPSLKIKENTVAAIQVPPPKDTVTALPTDYAERKRNVIRTLIVNTDSVVLRVYDNGVVDGDIVSVVYNDKVVVDKLSLTSQAVVVKIPVKKSGINTLVFHAHNLGEFPPNTALLEILYGNKMEELTVSSDLTVSSTIDIEYQQ